jgi:hypothetical protein
MRNPAVLLPFSLCLTAMLTGCGAGVASINSSDTPGDTTLTLHGIVHGGEQPVANATIQLYTVGSAGNGSAATSMIAATVTTNSNGNFSLHSGSGYDFACVHPTDQVYIVATGGNPGLSPSTATNNALVLMTALGNCSNLFDDNYYIAINEITTAAAAWALAPFMTGYANVGASSTNATGIANAMLDAQLLADSGTGYPPITLPSNLSVESAKLFAMADVLATCANSDGTTACSPLFTAATPTGGTAPTNTLTAALNIVKNPIQNPNCGSQVLPGCVFQVLSGTPVFPTTLSQPPNDWTMTLSVTGGGLNSPTGLGVDTGGNVWVAGYNGVLSAFSPQGVPFNSTGFGIGDLNESYGLAIDTSGNIWVDSAQSSTNAAGSISKFLGSKSATPGTVVLNGTKTSFYDASLDFPTGLSADTNGDIFIANYYNDSASAYSNSGAVISPTGLGSADASFSTAVAADSTHGVWIGNSEGLTVTHVAANGTIISNLACCYGSNGIATDSAGNAWITNYYDNSFSVVSSSASSNPEDAVLIDGGSVVGAGYTSQGAGVAVDAAQNVWIANYGGQSISELAGIQSSSARGIALGTMFSPAAGFGYTTVNGTTTPLLSLPYSIAPDASGNIWVSNNGNNNLVMFFGLATPTKTPVQPVPVAP